MSQYFSVSWVSPANRPLNPPSLGDFENPAPPNLGVGGLNRKVLRYELADKQSKGSLGR